MHTRRVLDQKYRLLYSLVFKDRFVLTSHLGLHERILLKEIVFHRV